MARVMEGSTVPSSHWAKARPVEPRGTALEFLGVACPLYARVADALAPSGLTYSEYRLLDSLRRASCLHARDAQPDVGRHVASQGDETTDTLEARGLVRRPAAGGVHLTAFGRARANMAARRLDALVADFASRLDMTEAVGLSDLLARLAGGGAGSRGIVGPAQQVSA